MLRGQPWKAADIGIWSSPMLHGVKHRFASALATTASEIVKCAALRDHPLNRHRRKERAAQKCRNPHRRDDFVAIEHI
jgi:hypothetical protein